MSSALRERYERMRKTKQYEKDYLEEVVPLQLIQFITERRLKEKLGRYLAAGGHIGVKIRLKYILRNPVNPYEVFLKENQPDKYERLERILEEASEFKETISISRQRLEKPKYAEVVNVSTYLPYNVKFNKELGSVGLTQVIEELENLNETLLGIRPANFVHHGRYLLELNGEKIVDISFMTKNQRVLKFLTEEEKSFGALTKPLYEEVFTINDLNKLAEFCYNVSPLITEDCENRPVILRRINPFGFPESIEGRYEKINGNKVPYSIRTGEDIARYILNEGTISFIPETHDFERKLLECVIDKDPGRLDFGYISWFFNDFNDFLEELGLRVYRRVTSGRGEHTIIPMIVPREFGIILPKGVMYETYVKRIDEKSRITDSAVAATAVLAYVYKVEREKKYSKTIPISLSPMNRVACLRGILMDNSPMLERHGRIAALSPHHKTGRVCVPVHRFPEIRSELVRITQMQYVLEHLEEYFTEPRMKEEEKLENFKILREVSNKYADSFSRNFNKDLTERLF